MKMDELPYASGRKQACLAEGLQYNQIKQNLHHKHSRKPVNELFVAGLVTEEQHTKPCTGTAAQCGGAEKHSLRNTPPMFFRLVLIQKHKCKSQRIDNTEVIRKVLHVNHPFGGVV